MPLLMPKPPPMDIQRLQCETHRNHTPVDVQSQAGPPNSVYFTSRHACPDIRNPTHQVQSATPRAIACKPRTHPPNSQNLNSGHGGDYDTENKPPCIPVLLLTSSVAQDCRAALTRLWRERYQMRAKMSRPTSSVVRLVDPSSAISASTARSIFAAASSKPR